MDKQSFGSDNNLPGQDGLAGHLSLRCSMLYITVQSPVLKRFLTVQDNKQGMPSEWPKDQSDASQSPTVAGDFRTQNDTFFLFFDLFYWGIVDLPHCVHFCCIAKWFSYIFIYALFQIHFHCDSSQDIDYGSLCLYSRALSIHSFFFKFFIFYIVVDFVIHWNETAMGLHVFPIPIPPPTSLSTRSLYVFPVHQVRALVVYPFYIQWFASADANSHSISPTPSSPLATTRLFSLRITLSYESM